MPRSIGEIENEKKKEYGRNVKEFDRDWYQTKEWRNVREEYRKIKREESEEIVMELYDNNPEKNSPEDLYSFMRDDKKYPLCRWHRKRGEIKVGNVCDHIHPITLGGHKTQHSNLQWLCEECHRIKTKKEMKREYE